ncbi:MAG: hypothetical protein H6557_15840 [Lewinellaceae bacterium]|nr:hypothetical protein [Lewinellaceae bacterium]
MSTNVEQHHMSNLQLELLKLYSTEIPEDQLLEIKRLLADYFARLIDQDIEKLWEKKGWTEEKIEEWKNAHLRTPYK